MGVDRDCVLLLTQREDYFTVDRVAEALKARGARPVRVDTDRFPMELQVASRLSADACDHVLHLGETRIRAEEVRAVWTRQLWPPRLDPDLKPEYRTACERNASHALAGFLDGLSAARWINPLARIRAGQNKVRQLHAARAAGLAVPRTLVTNRPEAVREFFAELRGRMVTKLLSNLSVSMAPTSFFMHTSAVREEDLDALDGLRHSPMIFQERIEKERELRVAYVDGQCFTGALRAKDSVDWRTSSPEEVAWQADTLPEVVERGLSAFMESLELVYGAIDLIRTPEGDHIFLEVNPTGEWGMLEGDLGLPVAEALAGALLEEGRQTL